MKFAKPSVRFLVCLLLGVLPACGGADKDDVTEDDATGDGTGDDTGVDPGPIEGWVCGSTKTRTDCRARKRRAWME